MNPGYALVSPYGIPASLRARKVANIGDGFIVRAIERLLAPRVATLRCSPRMTPAASMLARLQQAGDVVLAGANQLDDGYRIWPGMTAEQVQRAGWRFVIFGLGLNGDPARNQQMSEATRAIIEAIHQRIELSSWRCPATVRYLQRELPHLADRFVMTGCPVLLDTPVLDGSRFSSAERVVAVTATERGDYWQRETAIIDRVARRFPRARRYFVVHQDFTALPVIGRWHDRLRGRHRIGDSAGALALRGYAQSRGYQVLVPDNADVAAVLYEAVDVHVGSRLHAHLLMLSRNRRSWLVPVDQRGHGMAEAFAFPLVTPDAPEPDWDFDFEPLRQHVRVAWSEMQRFLRSWSASG